MDGSFKGLALLDLAVTDAELVELKDGGFSGFRIKTNGRGGLSFDDSKRVAARTEGFGWCRVHVGIAGRVIGAVPFLNSPKSSVRPCRPPSRTDRQDHRSPNCCAFLKRTASLDQSLALLPALKPAAGLP
jgi:hypothetical protein